MKLNLSVFIFPFLFFVAFLNSGYSQNPEVNNENSEIIFDTTGLNSLLNVDSYFPMRSAFGLELAQSFYFGAQNRTEIGINFLATSWHNLEKNIVENSTNETLGMFQIGAALSTNRVGFNDGDDLRRYNLSIIYNYIFVEQRSLGFTGRLKGSLIGPKGQDDPVSNFYTNGEIGVTFAGILNLYYGRNIPGLSAPVPGLNLPVDYVGLSLSLNVSYFKFGLQGM